VAERFVVPLKLGNAGGGKGPQFRTDALSNLHITPDNRSRPYSVK